MTKVSGPNILGQLNEAAGEQRQRPKKWNNGTDYEWLEQIRVVARTDDFFDQPALKANAACSSSRLHEKDWNLLTSCTTSSHPLFGDHVARAGLQY